MRLPVADDDSPRVANRGARTIGAMAIARQLDPKKLAEWKQIVEVACDLSAGARRDAALELLAREVAPGLIAVVERPSAPLALEIPSPAPDRGTVGLYADGC